MARFGRFCGAGAWAMVGLAATAGCSRPAEAPKRNDTIKPSYNTQTGRLEKITYDRNLDGKVDAWVFMDGTRVVRAEVDENFDGAVDRWEYYEAGGAATPGARPGAAAAGALSRVELSTRLDGKPSRWEFSENGQRVRVEEDTDADGKVDKWETWAGSTLIRSVLDTDGDGKPDRRWTYPQDGSNAIFEKAGADGRFPTP